MEAYFKGRTVHKFCFAGARFRIHTELCNSQPHFITWGLGGCSYKHQDWMKSGVFLGDVHGLCVFENVSLQQRGLARREAEGGSRRVRKLCKLSKSKGTVRQKEREHFFTPYHTNHYYVSIAWEGINSTVFGSQSSIPMERSEMQSVMHPNFVWQWFKEWRALEEECWARHALASAAGGSLHSMGSQHCSLVNQKWV